MFYSVKLPNTLSQSEHNASFSAIAKCASVLVSGRKRTEGRDKSCWLRRRSRGPQDPHSFRELSHSSPSRDWTPRPHPALGLRPALFLYTPTPHPPPRTGQSEERQ